MLGIDEGHVRDVPRSDAHRLAAQGSTAARFARASGDAVGQVDHVEVIEDDEWCVLRYRGVLPGVTVVTPAALPALARTLLEAGWTVDYEGEQPAWLRAVDGERGREVEDGVTR